MYRLFSIGVFLFWVTVMAALFVRDVWPAWTAQDPPPMTPEQCRRAQEENQQFRIENAAGVRMGTAWSSVLITGERTVMKRTLVLDGLPVLPTVRVVSTVEFDAEGQLDSFRSIVHGVPMRILVHGERRGIYFPCELHLGTIHRQASLDLTASRLIGDSFLPFTFLPTLEVGQAWRMQLLDPWAVVLTGKTRFTPIVATVTGIETIGHPSRPGEMVECFVVETSPKQSKALVDRQGQVIVQEANVPGLGKMRVVQEEYKDEDFKAARAHVPDGGGDESRNPLDVGLE